jgi:hypothetical protein
MLRAHQQCFVFFSFTLQVGCGRTSLTGNEENSIAPSAYQPRGPSRGKRLCSFEGQVTCLLLTYF